MAAEIKYVAQNNKLTIAMGQAVQMTGLVGADGYSEVPTPIWGYGTKELGVTRPGRTLEVNTADDPLEVTWQKQLLSSPGSVPLSHLLPVDTSLHWAYSLYGYEGNSIAADGVPVVTHVHGGHNDSPFNGNPEYFFSPNFGVKGPRWVSRKYSYADPDLNEDGSVDIYFGPKAPEGKEKNWIQTVPGKSWFVFFRLYGPTEPFFDRSWVLPDVKKASSLDAMLTCGIRPHATTLNATWSNRPCEP